jgi:hypothetical protein
LQEESKLLVATPAKFKKWFNVDVLENTEVTSIDRKVGSSSSSYALLMTAARAAAAGAAVLTAVVPVAQLLVRQQLQCYTAMCRMCAAHSCD